MLLRNGFLNSLTLTTVIILDGMVSVKSWNGCKWKNISLDLLPQVGGARDADDTSIERVERSSFFAAGDRLPVHLNSSCSFCMSWRYPDSRDKF